MFIKEFLKYILCVNFNQQNYDGLEFKNLILTSIDQFILFNNFFIYFN
jgi:hypothetical protein